MKKIRRWFGFSDFLCSGRTKLLFSRCFFVLAILLSLPFVTLAQHQKVTINVSKVDVQVVFKQIKEQTKLNFVYNADQLKSMSSVTLDVQNVTVDSALSKLFTGTSFEYKFAMESIVIKKRGDKFENERVVLSGRVVDKDGLPLPGVTVMLQGTTVGTVTDAKGDFKFLVVKTEKPVLVFSFIGMKRQDVTVKDEKPIKVTLEDDATQLDEVNVISTGYYNVDKRHLTSSVTSLKAEDIMMPGVSTIDQMLEGHVPGMIFMQNSGQVGASPRLKIRGSSTLLGSQAPLWVLDGVILSDPVNVDPLQINDLDFVNLLGNAISGLNPDDIDQIDVLKDASATAIYGPRASNGVIVITTKKGKLGAPSVSYSLTGSYRRRPRYTDRAVNVMNSRERIEVSKEIVDKRLAIGSLSSIVGYEGASQQLYNGEITYGEFVAKVRDMETCNTDWFDVLLKDAFSNNHTLNVSGGTDNIRYYASIGYSDENGNIRKESSKRYSAMTKINLNYNDFTMQVSLSGNLQKKDYTPKEVGVTDYAYNTSRSVRAYDEEGDLWFYQRHPGVGASYNEPFSIINERDNSYNKINTDQTSLTLAMGYRILPWLKADTQFSYNVSHSGDETYFGEDTWYAATLRKESLITGLVDVTNSLLPKGGELRLNDTKNESYSIRAQLTFNKCLDRDQVHQLSASVIGDLSSSRYTGFKLTRRGYMPDRGMVFDIINSSDPKKPYQKYNEWLLDLNGADPTARGVRKDNLTNLVGLIGTISYAYKNSYIFNANARIDASNKFGDASNERLLPIWSVSGRWNLHENVLKNSTWVNTLALKGSFGYQGNMSASDSPRLIIKKGGMDNFFGEYKSEITQYPNPNLKWEKTSTLNFDVEFSLFNNKLNGSVGYYYRHTSDAFLSKTVSLVNGVGKYTVNKGTLMNQGYELTLNFVPINTSTTVNGERRGFIWRFDPNFGSVFNQLIDKIKPKDKVLQDEITYDQYLNGTIQIVGRPVNTFFSYKYEGLSPVDGRPMFYGTENNTMVDGQEVSTRDLYAGMDKEDVFMTVMERSGCREPFLQGSISNYLGWKNWGLSFSLAYSMGAKVRLFKMYPKEVVAPGPETNMRREFVNRWRRPGDEMNTDVPGFLTAAAFSETQRPWWRGVPNEFAGNIWKMYDMSNLRVASGDYIKLQSLSLRYVVAKSFCQKLRMKSAYVSVSGSNLFTLCSKKLKGQDPSQSGSSDLINLSVRPMYSLQLNVTF